MPIVRDEDDERAARIDHMIAQLREHQARALAHIQKAKRTVARNEKAIKRIERRLKPRVRVSED